MKVKKISYRLLWKLVIPVLVLLCGVVYQLAIAKTLEQYHIYRQLMAENNQNELLSVSPVYTRERAEAVDQLYRKFLVDTLQWKDRLWNACAGYGARYGCTLQGFPAVRSGTGADSSLLVQEIVFSGRFHQLLRLQRSLDTLTDAGMLAGVSYVRDKQTGQVRLSMELAGLPRGYINKDH